MSFKCLLSYLGYVSICITLSVNFCMVNTTITMILFRNSSMSPISRCHTHYMHQHNQLVEYVYALVKENDQGVQGRHQHMAKHTSAVCGSNGIAYELGDI